MAKQMTIRIETKSLLIFRSRSSRRVWCPVCRAGSDALVVEPAGFSDAAAVEQWLKSEGVHRVEAPDGSLLLCLTSLSDRVQNAKQANRETPRFPDSEKERR
jgi:hypothetical protein